MTRIRAFALLAAAACAGPAVAAPPPPKLLVVTVTKGFRHDSIPTIEKLLDTLATKSGAFTLDYARTDEELAQKLGVEGRKAYAGVVFASTTGDLPIPDPQGFVDWIGEGHAFIGIHSATDTFPKFTPFLDMIGAHFKHHGPQVKVDLQVKDKTHPSTKAIPQPLEVFDEIYQFERYDPARVHLLLSIPKHPETGEPGEFPLAWTREHGKGRVFYTALGHRDDVLESAWYGPHLLGGITWALGEALVETIQKARTYDVCIVGSGAGGGMAAKVLAEAGADTVLLEAGPTWAADKDGAMFKWAYDSPRRGAGSRLKPFGEFDGCIGGWELDGEPYTVADGQRFLWWRARMLGGRTNHWGRISLRFGPYDFKGRSRDGLGDDWPIAYEDLAPYYDKLERLVGMFGSREGLPNEPDGIFQPPPAPRAYERLMKKASDQLKITCIPSRLSILTQPHNGRAACHYCGECGRGCSTGSNFSTPSVLLPPALATGKLQVVTGAMAREVLTNDEGLATGIAYVDTATGQEREVKARIVVLAASACETARLMLNSRSARHPAGLANSSGAVGRYLTDTTGAGVNGQVPALESQPSYNEDGVGGMHIYMPWWGDNRALDFPRGYHIEPYGGRRMPTYGILNGIERLQGGGYGQKLKDDYRRFYGSFVHFAGRGEMIPSPDCYCEVDPSVVDRYGIPVLRFHWKWSEYELNQAKHMQQTFVSLVETMGGKVQGDLPGRDQDYGLKLGGEIIHEAGTTRMGDNPRTSVLNAWCQAHDCKNLFVADSGPFVSNAHKNMTWTILALSMRTSEHIAEERNKGNL